MTGFEPRIFGIGSDHSANWATARINELITKASQIVFGFASKKGFDRQKGAISILRYNQWKGKHANLVLRELL